MKSKAAFFIPIFFSLWVMFSNVLLFFFSDSLHPVLTNILSIAYFIFIPLNPVLGPLGLVEGQMITGPTPLGILVGCLIYGLILFGIVSLIVRIKNPSKSKNLEG
jgi:hypothetical protein